VRALLESGQALDVTVPEEETLSSMVKTVDWWTKRASSAFLKRGCSISLLQVLREYNRIDLSAEAAPHNTAPRARRRTGLHLGAGYGSAGFEPQRHLPVARGVAAPGGVDGREGGGATTGPPSAAIEAVSVQPGTQTLASGPVLASSSLRPAVGGIRTLSLLTPDQERRRVRRAEGARI
jgi:hypothetical protein